MKLNKWHIWDLPDHIYVYIKDKFRNDMLNQIYLKFGSRRKFCLKIKECPGSFNKYHYGYFKKNGRKYTQYMSNRLLKKIIPFMKKEYLQNLESNIVKIRARAGTPICMPKLPLQESPQLYSIIGHMIADGCQSKNSGPYYANQSLELREEFKESLKKFGNFKINEIITKTTLLVTFPKIITNILQDLFEFQITHPNRIPNKIFDAPENCKSAFIAALFDDDGSVSQGIVLSIHNFELINQVKSLLTTMRIKTNKILVHPHPLKKDKITLRINSKSEQLFHEKIRLNHPIKKYNLNKIIETKNRSQRTRSAEVIHNHIINLLEYKKFTTKQLSNELLFTMNGLMPHLKKLEEENKIIRKGYKNKITWDLI
jgi:hypothetical protein